MDPKVLDKLAAIEKRQEEVTRQLSDPAYHQAPDKLRELGIENAAIAPIVTKYRELRRLSVDLENNRALAKGEEQELAALAQLEIVEQEKRLAALEQELRLLLLPPDPNDRKNIILEIRAGTGGEEAALFAADLFRMYCRYAERRRWRVETLSLSGTGKGGIKEVIALVEGQRVYSYLKYESGVHRVQRVPETEAQGRIHTSAVTVAILPEADEVEVKIEEKDLRIDVFRSSGPGGQSVNTTDSAVRITHLPSGLVVSCQDEKSQHKNKAKGLKILQARLLDLERQKQQEERSQTRRSQVGSGDRSEKIRTYNFPQNRLTDHRVGLTVYQLEAVVDGNLDLVIPELQAYFQAEALREGG